MSLVDQLLQFSSYRGFVSPSSQMRNIVQRSKEKPQMVLFHADWCGHCKRFMPDWKKMKSATAKCDFHAVECGGDSKEIDSIRKTYRIDGYPTIMRFTDGKVKRFTKERTSKNVLAFAEQ